jgi:mono/diheme cytochrome c family protein
MMNSKTRIKLVALVFCAMNTLLSATFSNPALAGGDPSKVVVDGEERFREACAFCHGLSGRGDGIAAETLETVPSDLTLLSKGNKGVFPLAEVYSMVDGRAEVRAHGLRDMPVWANTWSADVPEEYTEYYVKGRATSHSG